MVIVKGLCDAGAYYGVGLMIPDRSTRFKSALVSDWLTRIVLHATNGFRVALLSKDEFNNTGQTYEWWAISE